MHCRLFLCVQEIYPIVQRTDPAQGRVLDQGIRRLRNIDFAHIVVGERLVECETVNVHNERDAAQFGEPGIRIECSVIVVRHIEVKADIVLVNTQGFGWVKND